MALHMARESASLPDTWLLYLALLLLAPIINAGQRGKRTPGAIEWHILQHIFDGCSLEFIVEACRVSLSTIKVSAHGGAGAHSALIFQRFFDECGDVRRPGQRRHVRRKLTQARSLDG